jgi:hypothetical protein
LNINENFEQIIKLFASSTFAKKFQSLWNLLVHRKLPRNV